jgi:hypothetical protein
MTNQQADVAQRLRVIEEHINAVLAAAVAEGLKVLITVKPEADHVKHPTVHFDVELPDD